VSSVRSESRPVFALVTDAIGPWHRGGKEQRYVELAGRLAERAEVHIYTMNWWQGERIRRDGDVTYHAIAPLLPLYSGPRRSIRQAIVFAICCLRLLTERFDVIEADHMPYVQLFPLRLVAWLRRKRLVVTWHECWGPDYWRSYLGQPGRIGWLLERAAMRLPDMIIAASPQTADRLQEFTGGRVPIVIAPNGIDLAIINEVEAAGDPADVVVVGRLLPHKRIDLLLEALAILKEEGRPVTARIVGSGPQLADLTMRATALGLGDFVDFRQDIGDQKLLYGVLKASRVAVFPSEREGFGIAVLEALACGTPVITTSAPANYAQYLIGEAAGGVVCDPTAPALADAIRDTLERTGIDAGYDTSWLQRYNWTAIADSVADALS
jgi:glycosyltransferase involved in cell wall biosynthesis